VLGIVRREIGRRLWARFVIVRTLILDGSLGTPD
jgi:hypothetical protein